MAAVIETKKKKISKSELKTGRWVRTKWDDVGARDGIIVRYSENPGGYLLVYTPFEKDYYRVNFNQVIAVGSYLKAENTGL